MKAFHVPKAVRKGWAIKMLIGVIIAGALLFTAACMRLAASVMTGYRQTLDEAMEWQSAHYDVSFYQGLEKTDYVVSAHNGYVLHVQELRNPNPTNDFVILSHGYTDNRLGSLKYVPMYLDLGFNCVIYDLRGHGENEPTFTTYGILEGQDLALLVKDTRAKHPEITRLGLHGESLGAATTITALKYQPEVDFVVADCGFSDIENVLREGYKNANVPVFLADMADFGARLRYRYALKHMRPIDALTTNTVPVLFIHGEDDAFILPRNSQDMYDRTQGLRDIHLIPGAGHAESILKAPEAYQEYVREFLQRLT